MRLPDGQIKDREIIVHSGGSAIVAVDNDRFVYLVRQYRSAAGKIMLELPAGKLEKGETLEECLAHSLELLGVVRSVFRKNKKELSEG